MKAVVSFLFTLLSLLSFMQASAIDITPSEQAWLDKTKTLRVRITKDLPPYQFLQNGEYTGISVEYIQFFASTFNLKIKYVTDGTWSEALKRIQTRDGIDVILKATVDDKRVRTMLFSKPYCAFPFVLLTQKGVKTDTFFDATSRKLAIVPNYVINEKLKRDYPKFIYITYPNSLEAMKAVNDKVVDGFISDIAILSTCVKVYHFDDVDISPLFKYAAEEQSMVTAPDWPEFISLFNKMVDSMPPDLHVQIKRKYMPFGTDEKGVQSVPVSKIELSESEKAYLAQHPVISVTNERDWYPYDFNEDGEAKGFAVDYMKLLANKLGMHLNFISDTWPNLYEKFKNREIRMAQPLIPSEERHQQFLYSTKFITMDLALIAQTKRQDIRSINDLKGKTVGAGKGWPSTKYLKEEYPELKVVEYETSIEMLEAVAFGLIDAGVDDTLTAQYVINKEMLSNLHSVSKLDLQALNDKNLYIMMHHDDAVLQSLINKALQSVTQEEINALKSKWSSSLLPKETRLAFSLDEQIYLAQKKRITMCIDPDWMPLEMNQKGKHVGMAADYMHEMEQFIGLPIELVNTQTWLESLEYAKERKCDIFSLAMPTPERRLYMNFTHPYMQIPIVLISNIDKVFYTDIDMLTGKSIGIAKGYAYGEILKVRYPNMHFVEVSSDADGLKHVEQKKLFGYIGTLATVAYQIQKDYYGSLKIVGKFDDKWELGVATRNDEPLLLSIFEKAIESIDPTKNQSILNKWISVNYEERMNYTYIYLLAVITVVIILIVLIRQYQLKKYNAQLEILSNTDKLTGIHNRLKLDDILEYEKKIFDRDQSPLSIIIFDLDYFKNVNDNYGHKRGDEVLQSIAKIVTNVKRETDIFGRWGGEEFLLICRDTNIKGARHLAEKIRAAIEAYEFPEIISVTASFGTAQFEKYDSIIKIFDKADKALYEAKEHGRNRVV